MTKTRRLLVLACIAALLVTATVPVAAWAAPAHPSPGWSSAHTLSSPGTPSPAADLLFDVVAPFGPVFGAVISVSVHQTVDDLGTAPILPVRSSRGPPVA